MNYRKKIVNFMIPTIILLILNQAYAVVDNIIVAQYVNERALAILAACMSILNIGYSIVGGHPHCQLPLCQYPEVEAFVDKFLLGKKDIDTNVTKANIKSQLC